MYNPPEFSTHEFKLTDFIEKIFEFPPQDPCTFKLEMLDQIDLKEFFTYVITYGSNKLFNKQLFLLEENEVLTLKKYVHSIGYEVFYNITGNTINVDIYPYKNTIDDKKYESLF